MLRELDFVFGFYEVDFLLSVIHVFCLVFDKNKNLPILLSYLIEELFFQQISFLYFYKNQKNLNNNCTDDFTIRSTLMKWNDSFSAFRGKSILLNV